MPQAQEVDPCPLSFAAAAREAPGRLALLADERSWTFGELAPLVARAGSLLIESLAESPARAGSELPGALPPVALVGVNRLPQLVALYALVEAGIPFLLIHPRWPQAERDALLELFRPRLVIDESWRLEPARDERVQIDRSTARAGSRTPGFQTLAALFTSGTSGRPKAAVLSRRAVIASANASARNLGWHDDDRWLLSLPVAHVGGLSVVTRSLIARRPIVVPAEASFDADSFLGQVEISRVTLASLVPTQLYRLLALERAQPAPASLRAVLLGGARAPQTLVERGRQRGWPLLLTYGLTEACSQVATQSHAAMESDAITPSDAALGDREIPTEAAGHGAPELSSAIPPLSGVEIRIRRTFPAERDRSAPGETGHGEMGSGEMGSGEIETGRADPAEIRTDSEIIGTDNIRTDNIGTVEIRGPMLFDGYLIADPQGRALRLDSSCLDPDGWFSTGDLGRLDGAGRLLVSGRASDLVISGGENVIPSEVEAVLERHPSIVAACVFGVDDEEWGQRVAAAAVPREGSLPSNQELIAYLDRRLGGHQRPRLWRWLDRLDTAPSGKVDRRAVRDRALALGLQTL